MRAKSIWMWAACVLLASGCGGQRERARQQEAEFEKGKQPQDPLFINFEKNWRERISQAPELMLPVRKPDAPSRAVWEPIVISECVFSSDVGGLVPQTTLTWNEPAGQSPNPSVSRVAQQVEQPPRQRVDLAVHYDGLDRNYFSTALSTTPRERFSLPSNSSLVADSPTVLMTGPALFPRLMDFRAEMIQDRDTGHQLRRQTLVLRDLSEGQTYQIRLSSPAKDSWSEDRQYSFLTPACPKGS